MDYCSKATTESHFLKIDVSKCQKIRYDNLSFYQSFEKYLLRKSLTVNLKAYNLQLF